MKELVAFIKKLFGDDKVSDEMVETINSMPEERAAEFSKAAKEIEKYRSDMPEEYEKAVNTLIKQAVLEPIVRKEGNAGPDILETLTDFQKAGAALSKATITQLKKVLEILQGLVTNAEKAVKKGRNDLPEDVVADLEELKRLRAEKSAAAEEVAAKEKEKLEKRIIDLEDTVKRLEKGKGSSQQVGDGGKDGNETGKDGNVKKGDEGNRWPSLTAGIPEE